MLLSRLNKIMHLKVLALLGMVGLAACEPQPVAFKAPEGASAEQAVHSIIFARSIAVAIGLGCKSRGIELREPNLIASVTRDVEALVEQGYSLEDIQRAQKNAPEKAIQRKAVAYLESQGARKGDLASLCAVGLKEIQSKTAVGRQLKRV